MTPSEHLFDPDLLDQLARALAPRIVRALRELPEDPSPELIDVKEVARLLSVSRDTVYAHAEELGATRVGSGSKARLRFARQTVLERGLTSRSASNGSEGPKAPTPQAKAPHARRRRGADAERVPILPVRGKRE